MQGEADAMFSWSFSNGQGWSLEIRFHFPPSHLGAGWCQREGVFIRMNCFQTFPAHLLPIVVQQEIQGACPSLDRPALGDSRFEACRWGLSRSPQ